LRENYDLDVSLRIGILWAKVRSFLIRVHQSDLLASTKTRLNLAKQIDGIASALITEDYRFKSRHGFRLLHRGTLQYFCAKTKSLRKALCMRLLRAIGTGPKYLAKSNVDTHTKELHDGVADLLEDGLALPGRPERG
jgi:hypothetical protein